MYIQFTHNAHTAQRLGGNMSMGMGMAAIRDPANMPGQEEYA